MHSAASTAPPTLLCYACRDEKEWQDFSRNQQKKAVRWRKCRKCTGAVAGQENAACPQFEARAQPARNSKRERSPGPNPSTKDKKPARGWSRDPDPCACLALGDAKFNVKAEALKLPHCGNIPKKSHSEEPPSRAEITAEMYERARAAQAAYYAAVWGSSPSPSPSPAPVEPSATTRWSPVWGSSPSPSPSPIKR